MKKATQGLYFPAEKKYMNRLLAWVEQAMKRWEDCPMMTDAARQQAALLLAHRLETVAGQVLQALWEQRMKERNPVLELSGLQPWRKRKLPPIPCWLSWNRPGTVCCL